MNLRNEAAVSVMPPPQTMVSEPYQAVLDVPFRDLELRLGVRVRDEAVIAIDILGRAAVSLAPRDVVAKEAVRQLQAYFEDARHVFSLPVVLQGTPYQRRVWDALASIPPSKTLTYGEVAARVGGGPRAVGGACRRNPLPIVVPCHRAVSVTGLGGYAGETAGAGLAFKARLLAHEAAVRPSA